MSSPTSLTESHEVERRSTKAQVCPILSLDLLELMWADDVLDPATGEKLWDVPIANQQDVDDAVVSAQKAFEGWSVVPFEKRVELLTKFKDHYLSYADEMVNLLCQETGKPVSTSPCIGFCWSLITIRRNNSPNSRSRAWRCSSITTSNLPCLKSAKRMMRRSC